MNELIDAEELRYIYPGYTEDIGTYIFEAYDINRNGVLEKEEFLKIENLK